MIQGAYAEFIVLPSSHILRKPTHLSWTEAASIPENLLTGQYSLWDSVQLPSLILSIAYQALVLIAELKKGGNVLVHAGASGVGVSAIQLARFYGAWVFHFCLVLDEDSSLVRINSRKTVTATASTKEKLDWLLALPLGPTHVANYKTEDFSQIVKRATDNKGADVVIDFVGKTHWKQNIESLAVDGHMTMLALLSGGFCLWR